SSICVASFSMPPLPTYSSTLSLHDALPISPLLAQQQRNDGGPAAACGLAHEAALGCALQPGPARILEQQPRRSQAVLQARREGVLGCEPIVDGRDDATGEVSHRGARRRIALDVAGHPPAAVE